ncbi:hypothetical protein [Nonomuraea dietziae]|uniref:hypothetical protein n=1 Tax=Nonomuraea dietziae TaxID=65515 RepID=UPI0035E41EFB
MPNLPSGSVAPCSATAWSPALSWPAPKAPLGEEERRETYEGHTTALVAGGVESRTAAQDLLFTVLGLVQWNFSVPQLRRLVLDEPDAARSLARRRATVVDLARLIVERA